MSVSRTPQKKLIALRIPVDLYKEVEAIAQKEKNETYHTSSPVEISPTLLMLLKMGIETYKDRYGDG